jgi:dienelactone hydrolase
MNASLKTSLTLVTLIVCCLISSHAQTTLPDDISITPPSSAVSSAAAAFSGAWLGTWGGELPTALIVEQINSNGTARVIYSWGDSPSNGFKMGWARYTAQISNTQLRLPSTNGHEMDFTLQSTGLLLGRYDIKDNPPAFAELHRIPTTNALSIKEAAKGITIPWDEIRIPVHSEVGPTKGKTFALQTTVFRQPSAGKHPVVIFNHGSTGPGIIPTNYVYRGGSGAEFFRSLGYIVVVPMRKGRGQSEGPYLEEDDSIANAVGLDSAIEDLHAVVEYLSTQTDVDRKRIVLAGSSRGGFLSVAYAGRYPSNIIGVINFSGGWFGEGMPAEDFNFEIFGQAGRDAKIPMLWLYADHDSYYSLKFDEREFSKFQSAGGRGELIEVRDIPGEGHLLCLWVDRWQNKVTSYLNGL